MQRRCFHDRTWVFQVGVKNIGNPAALRDGESQARDEEGQIPTQFLLGCFRNQSQQFVFPALGYCGPVTHHAFQSVCGAIRDGWIVIPQTFNELGKLCAPAIDQLNNLPNTSCVVPAAWSQHLPNTFLCRHNVAAILSLGLYWRQSLCCDAPGATQKRFEWPVSI